MSYTDREAPGLYLEDFWDPEADAGFWAAEPAEREFAQGRVWDVQPANPVLAMTVVRTAEGDLSGLSEHELLGAIAATEKVAGQAAWASNRLAAEYAKRKLEWDAQLMEEILPEFAEEDYRQEIVVAGMTAKNNLKRSLTLDQLPRCMRLAHDGALDNYRQRVIAEETGVLDPALLDKADERIAAIAADRTPGSLRAQVRKIVMSLDPLAAEARRKNGSRSRRVEFWPEQSGNITMAAREMSVAVAAAIKQALEGWAKIMRAAGIEGTLDNLRHDAATALLLGRHPVTGAAAPTGTAAPPAPAGGGADPATNPFNPWEFGDYEPWQTGSPEPPLPGAPEVSIHLLITPGTLNPNVDSPAWTPEFGYITAPVARDLITAGTKNPASRWCATEVNPATGQAVSHGCARGRHRWPPSDADPPNGTGPPGIREFLGSLNLRMHPIATEPTDPGRTEPQYRPSRTLRHLIIARHATCATPGCDAPAVTSDMEHRIEYDKGGQTSEGNLDPGHRHCHLVKQRPDWTVIKTAPGETVWTGPSGRRRVIRPTKYLDV